MTTAFHAPAGASTWVNGCCIAGSPTRVFGSVRHGFAPLSNNAASYFSSLHLSDMDSPALVKQA